MAKIMIAMTAVAFAWLTALASQPQTKAPPAVDKGKDNDKGDWKKLFDGKSLDGWKKTSFGGEGEVNVQDGVIIMEQGNDMTGITYARGDFPKTDYELTLEARKQKGNDFFCTTTFPVGDTFCSFVVGGWGGAIVGLSRIDGADAVDNETTRTKEFKKDQWYKVRIKVTPQKIECWIDDDKMVDLTTKGKKITIRGECEPCRPLGIATWRTEGAVRDVRVRALKK